MRLVRAGVGCLMAAVLLGLAGCGGALIVHDEGTNVPPGQIRKEMTPGHNK